MRVFKRVLLLNFKSCKAAFVLFLFLHASSSRAQGLMFNSNDSLLTKRTSYKVFNSNPPVFQNHLYINFDLSLWDNSHLGYIFNLTGNNNSYSLSYLYAVSGGFLNFNIDRKSTKIRIPLQVAQLRKRKWIKVRVDFDLKDDRVDVYIDNYAYHASNFGLRDTIAPRLFFGKNPYYTEVPAMAIRNLMVGDSSKNYFFPLNESKGNIVHSSEGEEVGYVENPAWLINESYYWKLAYTRTFNQVAGLNFDPIQQKLFIFKRDSMFTYDSGVERSDAFAFKNPLPVQMVLGKNIFNTKEDKCYLYEVFDVPHGTPTIAALDMQKLQWETVGKTIFPQQRHHHNIFYDENQDGFYLFGGYGAYTYYNTFYKYNRGKDTWDKVVFKGDTITPRFFSAMGDADKENEIFIFGGYGNESGSQVVGGKQYYDLYRVNLQDHTIKKCWDIHPNEVFVPANNLILSKDKKYFYAMCYPHEIAKTSIKLYRFSIKDGSYQVVSAPIPVTSERIESDINLFLNTKANELLCTIQEFTSPQNSTVNVYSLAFPPLSSDSYSHSFRLRAKSLTGLIYSLLCVAIILLVIWFYKKRKQTQQVVMPLEAEPEDEIPVEVKSEEQKINAVYLLGEFTVFDHKGRDITYLFSPKIKQLFVLILLNSADSNGIGSKKISHILWPDKDITKTKNIKGVTFNHLRSIIGDIEGIELAFLNDIYLFNISDGFFCDYCFVSDTLKKNGTEKADLLSGHFELLNRGLLLADMADTWLDDFKLNYEEQLMDYLLPQLQELYAAESFKMVMEVSKMVLNIDPFNDLALKYQLKSCRRIKGIDQSKKIYDQFVIEYKKSLGIDYPFNFDKLIQ